MPDFFYLNGQYDPEHVWYFVSIVRIEFYREGQSSNKLKFEFFTQQVSPIDSFGKMVQAVTHK